MAFPTLDLKHLLLGLRQGKPAAFKSFYAATLPQVAAHLRRLGLNHQEDLEEVLQETYAEAYKSYRSLGDDQAALAWLFTIARRQWGRHLERRSRGVPPAALADLVAPEVHAAHGPAADEQLQARRLCREVLQLSSGIKDQVRRRAVEMFYFQECTLAEITAATGVGSSTLTTWLARFRRDVRDQLKVERNATPRALARPVWRAMP